MATARDIGLMLCRAAETAGWQGVAELGDDAGWVVDVSPEVSIGVYGEPALGTLHVVPTCSPSKRRAPRAPRSSRYC